MGGMCFFDCYRVFKEAYEHVVNNKAPVIVEAFCHRFRGHSISDAATYRTKEALQKIQERDPIHIFAEALKEKGWITEGEVEERKRQKRELVLEAMQFAEESPFPDIATLEEGVFHGG